MHGKPWRNEELKKCEEAFAEVERRRLGKGIKKAKTGVGCDGFHPKVPVDLT